RRQLIRPISSRVGPTNPFSLRHDRRPARLHAERARASQKSVRIRTHSAPHPKSQFGSELTLPHTQKVSSDPNSLCPTPEKSVRVRTHSAPHSKSQFGSELTLPGTQKVSSDPNSLFGRSGLEGGPRRASWVVSS